MFILFVAIVNEIATHEPPQESTNSNTSQVCPHLSQGKNSKARRKQFLIEWVQKYETYAMAL